MPLRSDPSLWFNLPGVVAAYQPVRAPDSLLARYNMRQGGTSAFRAEPGVLPAWNGVTGWTGDGTQGLVTGYYPNQTTTVICRFTQPASSAALFGGSDGSPRFFHVYSCFVDGKTYYRCGNIDASTAALNRRSGVIGINVNAGYFNGKVDVNVGFGGVFQSVSQLGVMCYGSTPTFAGSVKAFAIYSRTLTPAEVWLASRQMAYCDANPDWSVWSPRRKWFPYVLASGGFQAAWAERANRLIGGG